VPDIGPDLENPGHETQNADLITYDEDWSAVRVTETSSPAEPPLRTIGLLALAAFAGALNIRISDPLLPQVAHSFSATIGTAAIIVTAFTVGYGLFQLAFGPVGDRFGKYRIAALLSLAAGLATTSAALASTLSGLTIARFAAGAMSSAVIPLAFAWIGDAVPFERRQAVLARFLTAQFTGIVLSQAAGGYIGAEFGWRTVFIVVGAVHLLAGIAMLTELKLNPDAQPKSAPGANSFAAMLAGARVILRRPFVRVMLAAVFLECFTMYGAFAYVGADLVHRLGASFAVAGLVLAVFGAGAISYSLSARWLLTRLGERGLVVLGGAIIGAGFIVLAAARSIGFAIPGMVLLGLGFYMFHNTLQTNATQMAPEARGLAVSLFAFSLFIGQSIGVALAAPIVDHFGAPPVYLIAAVLLPLTAVWFRQQLSRRDNV
jgi:predicted MFS family arabinose efflux permease